MNALGSLRRYVHGPRRAAPPACDLCAAPLEERHAHVVDRTEKRLCCACRPCAVLFSASTSARFRTVPSRVHVDPAWELSDARWDALGVPVRLAFFFRPADGPWSVFFPSPAGATEAEPCRDALQELMQESRLARSVHPDVEALLVRRGRERGGDCLLVPIDACYELVALVRRHWKGFDGGDEARAQVDAFFAALLRRSVPLGGDREV